MSDSKNDKCIPLEDMYKKMMSTLSSEIMIILNGKRLVMYISNFLFMIHLNMSRCHLQISYLINKEICLVGVK